MASSVIPQAVIALELVKEGRKHGTLRQNDEGEEEEGADDLGHGKLQGSRRGRVNEEGRGDEGRCETT